MPNDAFQLRSGLLAWRGKQPLVVLAIFVMSAGVACAEKPSDPETRLEGVIRISPAQAGPDKAGAATSMPFANTAFVVQGEKGVVASFTTDDQGRFQISLPPGHYTVSMKGAKPVIGHFGPFEVDAVAGKTNKVEWECDSGAR